MNKILKILILVLLLKTPYIFGQNLPIKVANGDVSLRKLIDTPMQQKLENVLNAKKKWKELIDQKRMAVGLVDLSNVDNIRFARVNGNHMMYAASLPKIAVLLAAMDAIEKKELTETTEVKKDMKLMISKSNNQATTRMIDRLGYQKIEDVLKSEKYNLYNEEYGGGLWVGKRYASGGGKTNREPLKNLSHAATVSQVCRFYYLLAQGKLVNEQRSKQMLNIMEDPALHHKFVSVLDKIAPNARLFRKSGSWRTFHSDSVLVWGSPDRRYILVALIDDPNGEQIIRNLVIPIEKVLSNK
tara:strand:- start:527988 stop:528884 length:897 start_codon:yes stop_codon:yes gene_type:complete